MQILVPSHIYIKVKKIRIEMNMLLKKNTLCYAVLHYHMRVICKSLMEKSLSLVRNTDRGSSSVTDPDTVPIRP